MVKADNSGDTDKPSFNIPASKYYWLGDSLGAIPKWMFKSFVPIVVFATFISTTILWQTNWWQSLFIYVGTLFYFGKLWPVGWIGSFMAVGVSYVWYTRRKKHLQIEREELAQRNRIRKIINDAGER